MRLRCPSLGWRPFWAPSSPRPTEGKRQARLRPEGAQGLACEASARRFAAFEGVQAQKGRKACASGKGREANGTIGIFIFKQALWAYLYFGGETTKKKICPLGAAFGPPRASESTLMA